MIIGSNWLNLKNHLKLEFPCRGTPIQLRVLGATTQYRTGTAVTTQRHPSSTRSLHGPGVSPMVRCLPDGIGFQAKGVQGHNQLRPQTHGTCSSLLAGLAGQWVRETVDFLRDTECCSENHMLISTGFPIIRLFTHMASKSLHTMSTGLNLRGSSSSRSRSRLADAGTSSPPAARAWARADGRVHALGSESTRPPGRPRPSARRTGLGSDGRERTRCGGAW